MKALSLTILVSLILCIPPIQAQIDYGISIGGLLSQSKYNEGTDADFGVPHNRNGAKAGIFAEFPISKVVFFNPELNYVFKGFKNKGSTTIEGGIVTTEFDGSTHYIELPLNFLCKIEGTAKGWYYGAGPVIGYGFKGRYRLKQLQAADGAEQTLIWVQGNILFDNKDGGIDTEMHLKPLEIGANLFLGYALHNGLRINVFARPGFTNLSNRRGGTYKNNYIGMNIGYGFK